MSAYIGNRVRGPFYSSQVEIIALASDNRVEECDARLQAFCKVIGPTLFSALANQPES